MGCHTWFYKRTEAPIIDFKDRAANFLQQEIDDCNDWIEREYFEILSKEELEYNIKYSSRVLSWIKKGWIKDAAMKITSEVDDFHYSEVTKAFYEDAELHDVFRRGGYPEDELHSLDETLEYLEKNDDIIFYRPTIHDTTPREELKAKADKEISDLKVAFDAS